MSPRHRWVAAVALLSAVLLGVAYLTGGARASDPESFPHETHARLFPLCVGCHVGVAEGRTEAFYPTPESCVRCHDGVQADSVRWSPPPTDEPEPIRFTHPDHAAAMATAGEPAPSCQECHTPVDGGRMSVPGEVVLERCFGCHDVEARDHLVETQCEVCHPSAAGTAMGGAWLAGLPYPADHVRGTFLLEDHGTLAASEAVRCATCHTRERCLACHVDGDARPEVEAIPSAPPELALPRYAAHYSAPPSHLAPDFLAEHGAAASAMSCATCHTRDDCEACHVAPAPSAVASLPRSAAVTAPGVLLQRSPPATHADPGFVLEHGTPAAARPASCAACHAPPTCAQCHQAAGIEVASGASAWGTAFHTPNYLARHSTDAYGRRLECASCHDVGRFCRDCHEGAGFEARGRLGPGFHDAEPVWILRHGQPARQALESCASCHTQRNCLQCHSTVGAFRVNPHGPDFDPGRARERNTAICFACHLTIPPG